jgi:hypothetical protein
MISHDLLELSYDFTQFSSYDMQVCGTDWMMIGRAKHKYGNPSPTAALLIVVSKYV